MTLAMQSGTLVPAARKVMPMMTSGIPRVKPITVTWKPDRFGLSTLFDSELCGRIIQIRYSFHSSSVTEFNTTLACKTDHADYYQVLS